MKKIILIAIFCAAVLFPTKGLAIFDWSYKYWYCPVSWSEARVYFQIGWGVVADEYSAIYVAGEGPLPDSNEDNTKTLPFQYAHGHLPSSRLPWRQGGDLEEIVYVFGMTPSSIGSSTGAICRITVDEGITHIGNWWFQGLEWVTEASVPLSLQSIGEGAFKSCWDLPVFECSDKVKSIGIRAFESCIGLHEFNVYDPTGNYKISEAPLNIGDRAFANCGSLKHFKIPAGSTLGNQVFNDSGLESVDLGNNVKFGSNVFWGCKNFKQFTVPADYTLGDSIFSNSCLETVTVNDNVSFGKQSFYNCKNLKSITFLGRINAVTEGMFYGCSSLPSVNIPNGATAIGNNAFEDCSSLPSVNIPNSVTSIGSHAFKKTGLTSVIIPGSVTNIGEFAFEQTGLTSITVPGSVENIENGVFLWCGNLTSVKLCEGVKTVGYIAFQGCEKLETVSLPASMESIGEHVFRDCNNIKVIECNGTTPPAMHPEVFNGSDLTKISVCVPYGSVDAYRNADVWKNFKNIGTYPAGIHIINGENFTVNSGSKIKLTAKLLPHDAAPAIVWTSSNSSIASAVDGTVTASAPGEAVITATTGNGIFKDSCRITVKVGKAGIFTFFGKDNIQNSKHVTIPANCFVEDGIFVNNSSLETVTAGDNVFFGKQTFQNCTNLQSVTFRGRINELTDGMFQDCRSLSSVNIPDGVTSIGNNAFERCFNLQTVNIPAGVTSIGDLAFSGTFSLRTLNLPNSVRSIGANAFNASGIASINIPNSVTSIGEFAFNNTPGLTSVTLPNSVTKLGARAFKQSGLTSITVPGSVKNIEDATCVFCGKLTSVRICEGIKTIGDAAFQDGWTLETVSLPASLEYIDGWAFGNCPNLKIIECNGTTPPNMHSDAFINSDLTGVILYVPKGSEPAYRNAPVWKDIPNIVASPPAINN